MTYSEISNLLYSPDRDIQFLGITYLLQLLGESPPASFSIIDKPNLLFYILDPDPEIRKLVHRALDIYDHL